MIKAFHQMPQWVSTRTQCCLCLFKGVGLYFYINFYQKDEQTVHRP